jgi:hypothetical protein
MRSPCLLVIPLVLAVAACTDVEEVQRAVDETEREVVTHCRIIDGAGSLAAAQSELGRHAAAVDADVRRIRARLSELDDVCETDRHGVWDRLFAVDARIDVYLADAGDMNDVAAWRALCAAYGDDMDEQLASLRNRIDDLPCW